jgi:hypothetical protein
VGYHSLCVKSQRANRESKCKRGYLLLRNDKLPSRVVTTVAGSRSLAYMLPAKNGRVLLREYGRFPSGDITQDRLQKCLGAVDLEIIAITTQLLLTGVITTLRFLFAPEAHICEFFFKIFFERDRAHG